MTHHGFSVDTAWDTDAACQYAEMFEYAVLVVDYRMPRTDGMQIIEKLAKIRPDAAVVLVSAHYDVPLTLFALNSQHVNFALRKPWHTVELANTMHAASSIYWERVASRVAREAMGANALSFAAGKEAMSERTLAEVMLSALDMRKHENRSHCRRVESYSLLFGKLFGLSTAELDVLRRGALLHDIGTIGVPDAILNKRGPLTEHEWDIMRRHPQAGARMLAPIGAMTESQKIVLQHHERWDGGGYPMGLRGQEICLGARIFAVADAVESLLSQRPYREAVDPKDMTDQIQQ
jgi:putative nucleotidyltransferase with HDIG domain